MNEEQLKEMLENEEVQAYLAENFTAKTDLDAVTKKKEELLSEKKKLQAKNKALEEKYRVQSEFFDQIGQRGFDPTEVLAQTIAALDNPTPVDEGSSKRELEGRLQVQKQTYEAKLASQAQEYERRIAEEQEKVSHLTNGWNREIVENTLNAEMDRIAVAPKHKSILKAAFRNKAQVTTDEDGVRNVLITNDDGIEISAPEFFNNFRETDSGKEYIIASPSTGGGAPGGKGRQAVIDFNAERVKALQQRNSRGAVKAAVAEWYNNTK